MCGQLGSELEVHKQLYIALLFHELLSSIICPLLVRLPVASLFQSSGYWEKCTLLCYTVSAMVLCIQSQAMNICIILSSHILPLGGKIPLPQGFWCLWAGPCHALLPEGPTLPSSSLNQRDFWALCLCQRHFQFSSRLRKSEEKNSKPLLTRRYVKNKCVRSQYWVFQFMNTVCLSIFFKILNFLISVLSFPHTCTYHQVISRFLCFVNSILKVHYSIYLLPAYGNTDLIF